MAKEYISKSGHVYTDEDLARMAEEAERGEYPGKPGKWVICPQGRPSLCPNEDLVTVAFKVPRSSRDKLDAQAAQSQKTRSQLLRETLEQALA